MQSDINENIYRVANADIASEEFDGEFVVLDLNSGCYYSMDGAAAIVWKALINAVAPSAIAAACEDNAQCDSASILSFCEQLVQHRLIVATDDLASEGLASEMAAELAAQTKPPVTTMYDDLAELMMADPIHEVDESEGWPVRKPDSNASPH